MVAADAVTLLSDLSPAALAGLRAELERRGLRWQLAAPGAAIPGSYWGAPEAGLVDDTLHLRADTPLHSALHEACHFLCLDAARRARLHTDAGGDDLEECGVCYLQCLLADGIPGYSRRQLWRDMDAWGYSFRLGSAQAWFERDAADARDWLQTRGLVDAMARVTPPTR
jgi:hypothetical protein